MLTDILDEKAIKNMFDKEVGFFNCLIWIGHFDACNNVIDDCMKTFTEGNNHTCIVIFKNIYVFFTGSFCLDSLYDS